MKSTCSLIKKNKTETNKWRKLIINVHTPQKREKENCVCMYLLKEAKQRSDEGSHTKRSFLSYKIGQSH